MSGSATVTASPEVEAAFSAARASGPDPYARAILAGLNATGRHVYGGTVPAAVKARRRAANRRARAARRASR